MANDVTTGVAAFPFSGENRFFVLDSGNVELTAARLATGQVNEILPVPEGFLCLGAAIKIVTPDTGTTVLAGLGDGGNTTGFLAATQDLEAVAGTVYKSGDGSYGMEVGGKLYTADDTIDLIAGTNTAPSGCTVRVLAYGIRLY